LNFHAFAKPTKKKKKDTEKNTEKKKIKKRENKTIFHKFKVKSPLN
jgi:hypothetical protein